MEKRFPLDTNLRFYPQKQVNATFYREPPDSLGPDELAFYLVDEEARECSKTLILGHEIHALWGTYRPISVAALELVANAPEVDGASLLATLRAKAQDTDFYSLPSEHEWTFELESGFIDGDNDSRTRTAHEKIHLIDEQKARVEEDFV